MILAALNPPICPAQAHFALILSGRRCCHDGNLPAISAEAALASDGGLAGGGHCLSHQECDKHKVTEWGDPDFSVSYCSLRYPFIRSQPSYNFCLFPTSQKSNTGCPLDWILCHMSEPPQNTWKLSLCAGSKSVIRESMPSAFLLPLTLPGHQEHHQKHGRSNVSLQGPVHLKVSHFKDCETLFPNGIIDSTWNRCLRALP